MLRFAKRYDRIPIRTDVANGQPKAILQAGTVSTLAFSSDSKTLATVGYNSTTGVDTGVQLWDVTSGQLKALFIEYGPNSDVMLDRRAAAAQINTIVVPLLRLCSGCLVRIIGRYALPTTCVDCTVQAGRALAIQRAQALRKFMEAPLASDQNGIPTGLGFPSGRILTPDIAHDPEARDADPNSVTNRTQRRADLDIVTSNTY